MSRLLGLFAIIIGIILLLVPVLRNIPLNNFGSCLVIGLVLGGLAVLVRR